jgi:hypothetical protein
VAAFGYLAHKPRLAALIGLAGLLTVFGWSFLVLLPALAERQLRVDKQGYALLLSGTGAGALVAALLVAALGSQRRRLLLLAGVGLTTAGMFGLSRAGGLPAAAGCCALLGAGLILFFATSQAVVQLGASDHNRGRIMGIWSMIICGALPLGHVLAGLAGDRCTEPVALQLEGLGCAAAALGLLALLALGRRSSPGNAAAPAPTMAGVMGSKE